ncbi:small nuclear ribonucleoprotein [Stylonychia lemnae]|uniref:Small nuclear ribonucleoprotein n=1 Tax=Stylonychia lemnae TaxID=5949 RepID=A0A078B5M5_STYLE|nr:small nuclear ribonucleoprotein [Stylonychia lemnae]|eukprot:CDW88607.1 small nuclear ribonucleoprotein [Stylonychia lemnae]
MASKQGYGADLRKFMDLRVDLRLNCNRHVAGVLKGYDQFLNIVLDNAIEIISKDEKRELGTVVIRGNSVILWENLDKVLAKSHSTESIANKKDIMFLALILNFVLKKLKQVHDKNRSKMMKKHQSLPKEHWRNKNPIVLVHGFAGQTADKSWICKGYFHHALSNDVLGENSEVYEADVNPFGSLHDRACELYQQLIGISKIQEEARKKELQLSQVVYGVEHVRDVHSDTYYKIRYLKKVVDGRIFAYPNGIPGGWCRHRKIHLVGHSWGLTTIRYLQYLMSINFFKNPGYLKCSKIEDQYCFNDPTYDMSNFIASVTALNGVNNGSLGGYGCGYDEEKRLFIQGKNDAVPWALKWIDGEEFYELEYMDHNFMYDYCGEIFGFNKKDDESVFQYIKRHYYNDSLYNTNDTAACQFAPHYVMEQNAKFETYDNTYYFSITCNVKGGIRQKFKEVLHEPKRSSNMGLGFDLEVDSHINYTLKHTKYPKRKSKLNWLWRKLMHLKIALNPIALHQVIFLENQYEFKPPKENMNNALNPKMNNAEAIDYLNKDWISNHDILLPRYSQEFPRLSSNYNTKFDIKDKPWGTKKDPIFFDVTDDAYLEYYSQKDKYEKGVWHFGSYPHTDHLDYCGLPPILTKIRTLLGIEYRPLLWINLFNRLRTLEIEDQI